MEDASPLSETDTDWSDEIVQTLAVRREQVRQFSGLQRRKLSDAEAELARQLAQIRDELARVRQANLDGQAELLEGRQQIGGAEAKLRGEERTLAQFRREHEAEVEEVARQRQRFEAKLTELERQRDELEAQRADTKSQRRRIAQELKAHRKADQRELERRAAEIERRSAAFGESQALAGELEQARQRLAELERQAAARGAEAEDWQRRFQELQLASNELTHQQRLAKAEAASCDAGALADMKRRYELAMEDLRDQKKRVAELEKQLAEAPRSSAPAAVAAGGEKLDWEAQKRRMLAALEADADADEDEERQAERLKIQEVIAQTEAALAAKDAEIEELRQLLEAQSGSIGNMAVGAAAFADILSKDEVVQTERERLQQLQQEWEEKLREAEIDLSVQRAKIARERAEIEERQRMLEEQKARHVEAADAGDGNKTGKPPRGRWLARLGLKEEE